MDTVRIPYKVNKLIAILSVLVLAAASAYLGYMASTNDRGLIFLDFFTLGVDGATNFFWGLSLLTGGLAAVFVVTAIKNAGQNREIVINAASITSPKSGLSNKDVTVNYSEIKNISIQKVAGTRLLHIDHPGGKLSIPNSMVSNKAAFDELIAAVEARLGAHHSNT